MAAKIFPGGMTKLWGILGGILDREGGGVGGCSKGWSGEFSLGVVVLLGLGPLLLGVGVDVMVEQPVVEVVDSLLEGQC